MINIFSELKKVNYQLSNALSTMFLRRLDIFLHFETYVFQNPQKGGSTDFHIYQLDFLPHISRKNVTLDTGLHGYSFFPTFLTI